jgi:hypothetical protein
MGFTPMGSHPSYIGEFYYLIYMDILFVTFNYFGHYIFMNIHLLAYGILKRYFYTILKTTSYSLPKSSKHVL